MVSTYLDIYIAMRCPHQDQADSVIAAHPTRVRQRFTSSHTLLINLRRRGEHFQGGATRYFMDGTVARDSCSCCNCCIAADEIYRP